MSRTQKLTSSNRRKLLQGAGALAGLSGLGMPALSLAQNKPIRVGMPTILCHQLIVQNDRIVDYALRMPDQKRHAVEAFRALNYRVVASGDSYNDSAMLGAAHAGFWFHAPDSIKAQFPQFPACNSYDELLTAITGALHI